MLSRTEDGLAQGSGRSIHKFHLLEALESMPELFLKFGGHTHAAGLTMRADRVDEFRARFHAHAASRLEPEDFLPRLEIDALIDFHEMKFPCREKFCLETAVLTVAPYTLLRNYSKNQQIKKV